MTFQKFFKLSFILICVIIYLQCSKDEPTKPNDSEKYLMPLKVGNSWNFEYCRINTTTGDTTESELFSWTIGSTISINGSQYFLLDAETVAQNRNDGLFIAGYRPDSGETFDDLFFKYPISDGETYTYTTLDEGDPLKIKVTKKSINVPAGTFNCYVYQFIEAPFESALYLSPSIGLIRTKNFDSEGENIVLLSYNLN